MPQTIKLGLLLAGNTGKDMLPRYPTYTEMFADFLAPLSHRIQIDYIPVCEGVFPARADDYDAYLISGSRYGVYSDLPWIPPLKDLVRKFHERDIPQIGICFGHQIIAETLGGKAIKSPKGWVMGARNLPITADSLGQKAQGTANLLYMHEDQVIALPPNARTLLGDERCPYAGFVIPGKVLTLQGHPEFTPAYLDALIDRRGDEVSNEDAQAARKTLDSALDNDLARQWIAQFLEHNTRLRSSAA